MEESSEYTEYFNISVSEILEYLPSNSVFKSIKTNENSNKIYLISTLVIIVVGLIGHFLTIFVFGQQRFRKNSSNVYLLCLAINDSFYLVTHFFEDTVRTYIFLNEQDSNRFILALNIIDQNEIICRLVNYFRYVLRFVSAYIIVAFTIQRVFLVCKPFSTKFKSKKSAWITVAFILLVAVVINSWILFVLEIRHDEKIFYCDVKQKWSKEYFNSTLIYILLIMLVPILVIFICNSIIILKIVTNSRRDKFNILHLNRANKSIDITTELSTMTRQNTKINLIINSSGNLNLRIKPYYMNMNQIINKVTEKANNSKKITKMLVFISFTNAFLNLPYFILWTLNYYEIMLNDSELLDQSDLYSALKISEIFYLLSFGVFFYIYYASGSVFRNQLKYSSNFYVILSFRNRS